MKTSCIHFSNISWIPRVLDPITNPFLGPSSWLHPASGSAVFLNATTDPLGGLPSLGPQTGGFAHCCREAQGKLWRCIIPSAQPAGPVAQRLPVSQVPPRHSPVTTLPHASHCRCLLSCPGASLSPRRYKTPQDLSGQTGLIGPRRLQGMSLACACSQGGGCLCGFLMAAKRSQETTSEVQEANTQ